MKKWFFQIRILFTNILFEIQIKTLAITQSLYALLLDPKKTDEDEHRKELVCNILLIITSLFLVILDVLVVINYIHAGASYIGINPYIMIFTTGSFLCLLYLSRIGYTDAVSQGIIWILIGGGTYGQIMWGADLPSIILLWSFVITASSILISTSYSLYLSIGIGFGTIILQTLASRNILNPTEAWKTHGFRIDDAIEYAAIFILIAGVSWISNREISRSLSKAKFAKIELQKERDLLEARVIERTEQLHTAQVEKINNMYQLVEFGRISGGLFHDLMTPLNTLSLSISQIKEKGDTTNSIEVGDIRDIKTHLSSCIMMSKKITNFISLAKRQIQHTKDERKFEICTEIKNTICVLESKARQNNIQIFFSSQKNINIFGSPTLFSHIMTNLVSNAIDAYDKQTQGNPGIKKHKIVIYCTKKKRQLEIKVRDFGTGIPLDVQPHIFETFFTTKPKHGCGIGLSTTKHTIEKYFKGNISFTSDARQGTTFTIKIPTIRSEPIPQETS